MNRNFNRNFDDSDDDDFDFEMVQTWVCNQVLAQRLDPTDYKSSQILDMCETRGTAFSDAFRAAFKPLWKNFLFQFAIENSHGRWRVDIDTMMEWFDDACPVGLQE